MATFSYTYTLTNGTTADATQVQQNFTDVRNGVSDGTSDISCAALTAAGTATFNGNVTLGNASGDDITLTGSLASSIPIKTDSSYDIGTSSLRLRRLYADAVYGVVDGAAASAGDVGEIISASISSNTTANSTDTEGDVTGASLSLTAGHWLVFYALSFQVNQGNATGQSIYGRVRITDSSNTLVTGSTSFFGMVANQNFDIFHHVSRVTSLNISASATYKLRITVKSSTPTLVLLAADTGNFTGTDNEATFFAVRIR